MEKLSSEIASLYNYFIITSCFQSGSQWRRMVNEEENVDAKYSGGIWKTGIFWKIRGMEYSTPTDRLAYVRVHTTVHTIQYIMARCKTEYMHINEISWYIYFKKHVVIFGFVFPDF